MPRIATRHEQTAALLQEQGVEVAPRQVQDWTYRGLAPTAGTTARQQAEHWRALSQAAKQGKSASIVARELVKAGYMTERYRKNLANDSQLISELPQQEREALHCSVSKLLEWLTDSVHRLPDFYDVNYPSKRVEVLDSIHNERDNLKVVIVENLELSDPEGDPCDQPEPNETLFVGNCERAVTNTLSSIVPGGQVPNWDTITRTVSIMFPLMRRFFHQEAAFFFTGPERLSDTALVEGSNATDAILPILIHTLGLDLDNMPSIANWVRASLIAVIASLSTNPQAVPAGLVQRQPAS